MTLALRAVLAGVAALAFATPAFAQVELKNDGFTSGATPGFASGFATGEMGASRFVPPGGTSQLLSVRLLFGPTATQRNIVLHVYDDSAGTDTPGTQLYTGTFPLTGSSTALQEVSLSTPVFVTGTFRVAIEFTGDGDPSIASDIDGSMAADKNFVFIQGVGWKKSQAVGLTGDWIIRAVVSTQPPDGGAAGAGGSTGTAGMGGSTGTAGTGGSTGTGGTNGAAGTTGAAGTGGATGTAGASGTTGSAGTGGGTGGSGVACKVNSECPTGQYCLDKTSCTYDCRVDSDCGSNQRCTSLGQCETRASGGCSCRMNDTASVSLTAILGAGLLLGRRRFSRRPRRTD